MSLEYHGPHYDAEGRHTGTHYGPKCPGCRIHTEASEGYACWTPGCPAHGLAADSAEAARAAAAYRRSQLSGRSARAALEGSDAMAILERDARLSYLERAGELIDVAIAYEVEHEAAP
jgi:hypothetical protein